VIVYITDANVRETSPDGRAVVTQYKAGNFSWDVPSKHKGENLNDKPFGAVVAELRTTD